MKWTPGQALFLLSICLFSQTTPIQSVQFGIQIFSILKNSISIDNSSNIDNQKRMPCENLKSVNYIQHQKRPVYKTSIKIVQSRYLLQKYLLNISTNLENDFTTKIIWLMHFQADS